MHDNNLQCLQLLSPRKSELSKVGKAGYFCRQMGTRGSCLKDVETNISTSQGITQTNFPKLPKFQRVWNRCVVAAVVSVVTFVVVG